MCDQNVTVREGGSATANDDGWETRLDRLQIEVTHRCNLHCKHCYLSCMPGEARRPKLKQKDWIRVLAEGRRLGCRRVQFIGGEPTLARGIPGLIRSTRAMGYEDIELFTNGTRLGDELLATLREADARLAFSVYSHQADRHDRVTGRTGSYRLTLDGIRRAVALGIPCRAAFISMPDNEDDAAPMRELLLGLGVTSVDVDRVRKIGRGAGSSERTGTMSELCGHCWEGGLAIDPTGRCYPCVMSRFYCAGHVQSGLASVMQGDLLRDFRRQSRAASADRMGSHSYHCSPNTMCPPFSNPCEPTDSYPCRPNDRCRPVDECAPDCSPHDAPRGDSAWTRLL